MIRPFFFLVFLFSCLVAPAWSQVHLERISVADRSDGLGYVMRFHLSEPVDSVSLARPEPGTLQNVLWSSGLTYSHSLHLNENTLVRSFQIVDIKGGLGLQFTLSKDETYNIEAYPDQNRKDYLIAFERDDNNYEQKIEGLEKRDLLNIAAQKTNNSQTTENVEEGSDELKSDEPSSETKNGFSSQPQPIFQKNNNGAALQTLMPGDPIELYLRTMGNPNLSDSGLSYHLRTASRGVNSEEMQSFEQFHPWQNHTFFSQSEEELNSVPVRFSLFSPKIFFSHNSTRPAGFNDGALWQGKGMNWEFTTGVALQAGPLNVVFRPVINQIENRDFDLSDDPPFTGLSRFAMAKTNADIPQRFGEDPITRFDLGDSYVELNYKGFSGGLSNQRMWTGPAVHNPLMLSSNAPGFLHFFAGTNTPLKVPGGYFEGKIFWGGLRESEYFDENPDNNLRYISGFTMGYSPDFVPGLHVGFTRIGYSYYGNGLSFSDLFLSFKRSPLKRDPEEIQPNDAEFIKSSVFIRWAYPEIGFEVYAEWGRNDDRRGFRDLIAEPELNRGYVLGVIQRVPVNKYGFVILNGEITNLENLAVPTQFRDTNIWYANDIIRQGFTHQGQVLGAAIGPGSSTQVATASFYHKYGMAGFSLARIAMHNDRLFENSEYYQSTLPRDWMSIRRIHEVETRSGFHALVFLPGNLELQTDLYLGKIENRYNNLDRPRRGGFNDDINFDETNVNVSFTLRYYTGNFLR